MKNEAQALQDRILALERLQKIEYIELKEALYVTFEGLKPINLIKDTLHDVSTSSDLKDNMLDNVIGLTTGYLSKKIVIGATHNPIKKILGTMLQFGIANVVAKHSETIKAVGELFLRRFLEKKSSIKHLNIEINESVAEEMKDINFENIIRRA